MTDAEKRYRQAHELELKLADQWRKAGEPTTIVNDRGIEVIHPLLKALQQAARDADRFAKAIGGPRPGGRPVGASSAPDRGRPGLLRRDEPPRLLTRDPRRILRREDVEK